MSSSRMVLRCPTLGAGLSPLKNGAAEGNSQDFKAVWLAAGPGRTATAYLSYDVCQPQSALSTDATPSTEALRAGLDAGLHVGGQGCISWKQPRLGDMLFPPGDLQGF